MPSTSNPASVMRSASCLSGISRSTYSFNHEIGTNMISLSPTRVYYSHLSNSLEEPHIVRIEVADVVDAVSLEGYAFRTHAECEATELAGIVATVLQHDRMYHACPHDLQP